MALPSISRDLRFGSLTSLGQTTQLRRGRVVCQVNEVVPACGSA
jgi:hypothetical protein